jgi:hypothetical protein
LLLEFVVLLICGKDARCVAEIPLAAATINGFLKGNDLNRRRFQGARFKTATEFGGDLTYLSRRQLITIYSKQTGEIVIEIDQVETDVRLSPT